MRATVGLLFVSLVGACAGDVAPARPARVGLAKYADAVDWKAAGEETAGLLAEYLKVDTVNPPGNELRGARFLAERLQREGLEAKVVELGAGRANLMVRLAAAASTEKPLCLLSHLDVVSAEDAQWQHAPLSGEVVDGYVWGRGALDMKGMTAVELMTVLQLKRRAVPLNRDVVLLAVAGEEVDSFGMRAAVASDWPGCGGVVNEGGIGLKNLLFEGQTVFAISVAEKGALWLRLRAKGNAGHGSVPQPGRAPMELLKGAQALLGREAAPRVHDAMYELLRRAGAQAGGVPGFIMQRPALVDLLVQGKLLSKPTTRAGITDTCQVTGYSGIGTSVNVVPSEVYANVDCRLLPGTSADAMLAELKDRVKDLPYVSLEVVSKLESNGSTWDDPLFDALARNAVRGRTDAIAAPVLSTGYTDSLLARPLGARAYGFIPFEISQEELATMHGKDERVSVANLQRGAEVLFRAVVDVAGSP
ncbi:MAG: M20/M25/M40 family metallo-hydrolase [Archangiaceae bacterium]|nr:M20/M25/M40 family metallo-hydrolase [Archangiaceae bacterium]